MSELPYAFRKRLTTLAPKRNANELGKLCKNEKIQAYDHVFITNNNKVYQWASKDTFLFRVFKFLHQFAFFRFLLDGICNTNPMWQDVISVADIGRNNETIYVEDTLVLYCNSISAYEYVIPYIHGHYKRLILHGNIRWDQVLRLLQPSVKRIRINATVQIPSDQYHYFAQVIARHVDGFNSSCVMHYTETLTAFLELTLREACNGNQRFSTFTQSRICIDNKYNGVVYCGFLLVCLVCFVAIISYVTVVIALGRTSDFINVFGIYMFFYLLMGLLVYQNFSHDPPSTDKIPISVLQN